MLMGLQGGRGKQHNAVLVTHSRGLLTRRYLAETICTIATGYTASLGTASQSASVGGNM